MSTQTSRRYGPWIALICCFALSATALALAIASDAIWKFQSIPLIAICFASIVTVIAQMQRDNRDLRRQVARLEEKAGIAGGPPKDDDAKGAYDLDEEGRRRLHISRLE